LLTIVDAKCDVVLAAAQATSTECERA